MRVFISRFDVPSCEQSIRGAARPDAIGFDMTIAETPVFRFGRAALQVRFKRALVHVGIHNWFHLQLVPATGGGTEIRVAKYIGVARGWWLPMVIAGVFVAVTTAIAGQLWVKGTLLAAAGVQAIALALGSIATAVLARGDRARLTSFLRAVVAATEAAEPRVAADRAAPGR